jgi:hypothetical protein
MANLTSLLYPISAAVTALPGSVQSDIVTIKTDTALIKTYSNWSGWSVTTTNDDGGKNLGPTNVLFSSFVQSPLTTWISSIVGISFAPYDQYLQIWKNVITWNTDHDANHGYMMWCQKIKSNENFDFQFPKGITANPIHIVISTTPLTYTAGNLDVVATVTSKVIVG